MTKYADGWYWLEITKDKTLEIVKIDNRYSHHRKEVPYLLALWGKTMVVDIPPGWKLHGPIPPPQVEWTHGQGKET